MACAGHPVMTLLLSFFLPIALTLVSFLHDIPLIAQADFDVLYPACPLPSFDWTTYPARDAVACHDDDEADVLQAAEEVSHEDSMLLAAEDCVEELLDLRYGQCARQHSYPAWMRGQEAPHALCVPFFAQHT